MIKEKTLMKMPEYNSEEKSEAISLTEYAEFNQDEKKDYILKRSGLSSLWLAGRVKKPLARRDFFHIEELVNPFTGNMIPSDTFKDFNNPLKIYCKLITQQEIENNELVVVEVSSLVESEKIRTGVIFECNFNQMHRIYEPDDVYEIIGMRKEDLGIYGLVKSHISNESTLHLKEIARDIIKPRLDLEKNKLDLLKEKLAYLGFQLDDYTNVKEKNEEKLFLGTPSSFDELIKGIQNQLYARDYYYELATLRQLLLSLMTEQMIILSGPSGTGKTSIVKLLATIINAECEIIPVQPSWTDKQDLLGFYNPIRKVYVPTPFLDCLIKANQNQDRLYFICLDEINLSQIEYYLADILSIRELKDGQLSLYSGFEYKQNMDEIRWFVKKLCEYEIKDLDEAMIKLEVNSVKHYELKNRYENLKRYLPNITIPSNIRIIGTMNVDGNVQALSPKVIDRSFVIPLNKQKKEQESKLVKVERYNLSADYFKIEENETVVMPSEERVKLEKIQNELEKWNLRYNMRFDRHIMLYYSALKKSNMDIRTLVDDIALLKILPRVHEMLEEEEVESIIEVFQKQVETFLLSEQKLKKMQLHYKNTKIYSYWS